MAGSPSRTVLPERNDRRLINLNGSLPVAGAGPVRNNLIAVTRRENGAISVPKATTVPEGVPVRALWGVPVEGAGVVAVNSNYNLQIEMWLITTPNMGE